MAEKSTLSLIHRICAGHENEFQVERIPSASGMPVLEIETVRQHIVLRGNDGVSLASALNWYLKHVAHCQISTRGDHLHFPKKLIRPVSKLRKVSPYRNTSYLNYCTFCYTATSWGWKDWEREIDMLAMSGVRNPLMALGNEKVWKGVLVKLGYSKNDIASFIPSNAYTAWWLMGNLEGEGGPVPDGLIDEEYNLAKRVLGRMKEFGMEPVEQGFCGIVPTTLPKYLPHARILDQGKWAGGYQRPSVLSPLDPSFQTVASLWYSERYRLYGKGKFYGGDLFHEGGRSAGLDLGACARAVQLAMRKNNPEATWVLQGWSGNPPVALLKGTDPSHVLVEYLQSYPTKANPVDFAGRPWTYTAVNTFGGHESLGGSLKMAATIPSSLLAKDSKNNVGLGILDEGLDTNPAFYDLFSDMIWEKSDVNLDSWIADYVVRRYGAADPKAIQAWKILAKDLLGHESENLLCARPRFGIQSTSSWGDSNLKHDLGKMLQVTELLLACGPKLQKEETYLSDCIDAMRQLFNDSGVQIYQQLSDAYSRKDQARFDALSAQFLHLLESDDKALGAGGFTQLGSWIAGSRAKGATRQEKDLLERNARQLVTLWTPGQTDLSDYAYRSWSGLTRDYYLPRWKNFLTNASRSMKDSRISPDYNGLKQEIVWVRSNRNQYPVAPAGNRFQTIESLFAANKAMFARSVAFWRERAADDQKWSWTLSHSAAHWQTLSWDITSKVKSLGAGTYKVTVTYQHGNNAIVIADASLLKKTEMAVGSQTVSSDAHPGRSGVVTKDNLYQLNLSRIDPHAQYILMLSVFGDGGNDSTGRILIQKK